MRLTFEGAKIGEKQSRQSNSRHNFLQKKVNAVYNGLWGKPPEVGEFSRTFVLKENSRETARQLPTWRGLGPPGHYPSAPSGYTYAYGRIRKPQHTYVTPAVHQVHFNMNREFKVIQGRPYWCRQASRTVCCRNVQLIPTLFRKFTKIWQQKKGQFVDFNDPTQVRRRPSKKRLRISTNDLYCQNLELLAYICGADSMGLCSLISFHVIMLQSRTL